MLFVGVVLPAYSFMAAILSVPVLLAMAFSVPSSCGMLVGIGSRRPRLSSSFVKCFSEDGFGGIGVSDVSMREAAGKHVSTGGSSGNFPGRLSMLRAVYRGYGRRGSSGVFVEVVLRALGRDTRMD